MEAKPLCTFGGYDIFDSAVETLGEGVKMALREQFTKPAAGQTKVASAVIRSESGSAPLAVLILLAPHAGNLLETLREMMMEAYATKDTVQERDDIKLDTRDATMEPPAPGRN